MTLDSEQKFEKHRGFFSSIFRIVACHKTICKVGYLSQRRMRPSLLLAAVINLNSHCLTFSLDNPVGSHNASKLELTQNENKMHLAISIVPPKKSYHYTVHLRVE